jgi:hypothetical protein
MLQYRPWLDKDFPLNKAIDAAHKRGISLISMKQTAGNYLGDNPRGNILDDVVRRVPVLAKKKLTPYQGLLYAIWTDERLSAVCTTMGNTDHIRENTDVARRFEPFKEADIHQLLDPTFAHGPMLCADCDGRCSLAAGTRAELGNLTRFLTYHEHHGDRRQARQLCADLSPEARDWSGADLEAARAACPARLDFARLLPQVERQLARTTRRRNSTRLCGCRVIPGCTEETRCVFPARLAALLWTKIHRPLRLGRAVPFHDSQKPEVEITSILWPIWLPARPATQPDRCRPEIRRRRAVFGLPNREPSSGQPTGEQVLRCLALGAVTGLPEGVIDGVRHGRYRAGEELREN